MSDLIAFLRAALDEDEAMARAAAEHNPPPWSASAGMVTGGDLGRGWPDLHGDLWDNEGSDSLSMNVATAEHVARHDPARALADVQAKRRIVESYREERVRRDIYQADDARAVEDEEQVAQRRSSAARCRGLEIAVELLAQAYGWEGP